MKKIKVLIADDHPLVRSGILSLLAGNSEIEVSAEASTGNEAIEKAIKVKPDVILMDISMPGMSGLDAADIIKRDMPGTGVVILTMHEDKEYMYKALKRNINGLIHKSAGKNEIVEAIKTASEGKMYYGKTISELLRNNFISQFSDVQKKKDVVFTRREKEILEYLSEGLSSAQIAERLSISQRTVDFHRSNLVQKLELKTAAALVKFAVDYNKNN